MAKSRAFGTIRTLPSGRFQARYWHLGKQTSAGSSFAAKADARAWLASVETDLKRGDHFDPSGGAVVFDAYAREWMANRSLRPRTRETYDSQLRHILAQFGRAELREIKPGDVRNWHGRLAKSGLSPNTTAKVYRMFRTIMSTALDDDLIQRSMSSHVSSGRSGALRPSPLPPDRWSRPDDRDASADQSQAELSVPLPTDSHVNAESDQLRGRDRGGIPALIGWSIGLSEVRYGIPRGAPNAGSACDLGCGAERSQPHEPSFWATAIRSAGLGGSRSPTEHVIGGHERSTANGELIGRCRPEGIRGRLASSRCSGGECPTGETRTEAPRQKFFWKFVGARSL